TLDVRPLAHHGLLHAHEARDLANVLLADGRRDGVERPGERAGKGSPLQVGEAEAQAWESDDLDGDGCHGVRVCSSCLKIRFGCPKRNSREGEKGSGPVWGGWSPWCCSARRRLTYSHAR